MLMFCWSLPPVSDRSCIFILYGCDWSKILSGSAKCKSRYVPIEHISTVGLVNGCRYFPLYLLPLSQSYLGIYLLLLLTDGHLEHNMHKWISSKCTINCIQIIQTLLLYCSYISYVTSLLIYFWEAMNFLACCLKALSILMHHCDDYFQLLILSTNYGVTVECKYFQCSYFNKLH